MAAASAIGFLALMLTILVASSVVTAQQLRARQKAKRGTATNIGIGKPDSSQRRTPKSKPAPVAPEDRLSILFYGPDGDFTIQLPFLPRTVEEDVGGITKQRGYIVTDGGYQFAVFFIDVGGDANAEFNNRWDEDYEYRQSHSAERREAGHHILSAKRVKPHISEWLYYTLKPDDAHRHYQMRRDIVHRGRVYNLFCHSVKTNVIPRSPCDAFFASFTLTSAK